MDPNSDQWYVISDSGDHVGISDWLKVHTAKDLFSFKTPYAKIDLKRMTYKNVFFWKRKNERFLGIYEPVYFNK